MSCYDAGWEPLVRRARPHSVVMVTGSDDPPLGSDGANGGGGSGHSPGMRHRAERREGSRWVEVAPLPRPRFGAAATLLADGRLIVTGGFDGHRYVAAADEYDPGRDEWRTLPPMPTARGEHAASLVGDRLVVVGGVTAGGGLSRAVEEYDPLTHRWRGLPSLPVGRARCAACAPGGRLVVVGGDNDAQYPLGLVEELPPGAREWHRLPSQLCRRAFCTAAAGAGVRGPAAMVVVRGGLDEHGNEVPGAEELDLATGVWAPARGLDDAPPEDGVYRLEARALLHGDAAEVVELQETVVVTPAGPGGACSRAYCMYESLTVPAPRCERSPPSNGMITAAAAAAAAPLVKVKKHVPVAEGRFHNRILLSR